MDWERFSNSSRRKKPVIARKLHFAGYDFTASPKGTTIHREKIRAAELHKFNATKGIGL